MSCGVFIARPSFAFPRIDRLDAQLNSYLTLCRDQALADARAADEAVQRGSELGPLHRVMINKGISRQGECVSTNADASGALKQSPL